MNAPTQNRENFWSRRKAAVEAEQEAERTAELEALQAEEEAKLEEKTDAEFLAELDLPDPDEMEHTEQVQTLLKSTVPQRLKTRALRRLWRLNPVLANVDGLVDYGEDFTDAATVVENLQTTYQVGKGMLKALEWESPKPADPAAADEDDVDDDALIAQTDADDADTSDVPADDAVALAATDAADGTDITPVAAPQNAAYATAQDDDFQDPLPAPARRMRFRFEPAT